MKIIVRRTVVAVLLLMLFGLANAGVQSPLTVLKSASNQMIAALERNKSRLDNSNVIFRIVNRILVPHVDANRMAALVVGPQQWRRSSPQQRRQFVSQFKQLVISTYAAALSSYNGDHVRFYPLHSNYNARRTINVKSVIIRRSGQRIPVNYNLRRAGNTWKIYDFSIENVSMVRSYRAQFASVLASSGMSGLIHRLTKHNRIRR